MISEDGFTLPELLVSLVVLSLTTMLAAQALKTGFQMDESLRRRERIVSEVKTAQDRVRAIIEDLQGPTIWYRGSGYVGLTGTSDQLSILSAQKDQSGTQRLYLIDLLTDKDGNFVERDSAVVDGRQEAPSSRILLRSAETVNFSFLTRSSAGLSWVSNLGLSKLSPVLIRVDVRFSGLSHRDWPELLVAPGISVSRSCQFDISSTSCRDYGA